MKGMKISINPQPKVTVVTAFLLSVLFVTSNALAMTVPAAGSFAYDLYDIGVNQILLGPVGFTGGVACHVRGRNPGYPADDPAGGRGCLGRGVSAPGQHRG